MASSSTSTPPPGSNVSAQATPQNDTAPAIFLSYSRFQLVFVKRLHNALVHAGHSPFFDLETIQPAKQFREYIDLCTRECRLGVVVLSSEYVTSKWPMHELVLMTKSRHVEIYPLFYGLTVDDLKDPGKLFEWRLQWREIATKWKSINVSECENAVNSLLDRNGAVFHPNTVETDYISNIVAAINKRIRPVITYDISYVKGQKRLIEEIEARFNSAKSVYESSSRPCTVGLYGVAGLGKTTLCKLMVNFYQLHYAGKCGMIEFPTKRDMTSIVEECKKILRRFTTINETLLGEVKDFDKAVHLMREYVKLHKVFLAIDNVWEHSLKEAKRILNVGFVPESRVLVTSRADAVLKELLQASGGETCVGCVPSMDQKESLEMLEAECEKDLSSLVSQDLVNSIVKLGLLDGAYHPLALNALGRRLRRTGPDEVKTVMEKLTRQTFRSQQSWIDELIRINFDAVPPVRQHAFLDVAVTFSAENSTWALSPKELRDHLRICYEEYLDSVDDLLEQLTLDGLVQLESNKVRVHDLYLDLARREAVSSGRFLLAVPDEKRVLQVHCAKLERIVVYERPRTQVPQRVIDLTHVCENVQVLIVDGFLEGMELRLKSMRSLRMLKIIAASISGYKDATTSKLQSWIADVDTLTHVRSLDLFIVLRRHRKYELPQRPLDLGGCRSLRTLSLQRDVMLKGDCLPALRNLQSLKITSGSASDWKKFPNLSGLDNLEDLEISKCDLVKEIADLPPNLQSLRLYDFRGLKRLLGIGTLDHLVSICMGECASLEEIGALPSNIQEIDVNSCPCLKGLFFDSQKKTLLNNLEISDSSGYVSTSHLFPNLQILHLEQCPNLRTLPVANRLIALNITRCSSLEEINMLPFKLHTLKIEKCDSLQKIGEFASSLGIDDDRKFRQSIPGLSSVSESSRTQEEFGSIGEFPSSLQTLWIDHREFLHKLPQLPSALRNMHIEGCESIGEFPSSLRRLTVLNCECVQGIWKCPSNVTDLDMFLCQRLQGISEFPFELEHLSICKCESLLEISGMPSGIWSIRVRDCPKLKKISSTSGLEEVIDLSIHISGWFNIDIEECESLVDIEECESLVDIEFPSRIREIDIKKCTNLKKFPPSGSAEIIRICGCGALEEISEFSSKLEELNIEDCKSLVDIPEFPCVIHTIKISKCPNLKKFPSTSGSAEVSTLEIYGCGALEEISGFPSKLEKLIIEECESLVDIPEFPCEIQTIMIIKCPNLKRFPWIKISKCPNLTNLPSTSGSAGVSMLRIKGCGALEEISEFSSKLERLYIEDCESLVEIPEFPCRICQITISKCPNLKKFPSTSGLFKLRGLRIEDCGGLDEISEFPLKLETLNIRECESLVDIPEFPCGIQEIDVSKCPNLKKFPSTSGLAKLRWLTIKDCGALSLRDIGDFPTGVRVQISNCKDDIGNSF